MRVNKKLFNNDDIFTMSDNITDKNINVVIDCSKKYTYLTHESID